MNDHDSQLGGERDDLYTTCSSSAGPLMSPGAGQGFHRLLSFRESLSVLSQCRNLPNEYVGYIIPNGGLNF